MGWGWDLAHLKWKYSLSFSLFQKSFYHADLSLKKPFVIIISVENSCAA